MQDYTPIAGFSLTLAGQRVSMHKCGSDPPNAGHLAPMGCQEGLLRRGLGGAKGALEGTPGVPLRGDWVDGGFWPKDLTSRVTKCPILTRTVLLRLTAFLHCVLYLFLIVYSLLYNNPLLYLSKITLLFNHTQNF